MSEVKAGIGGEHYQPYAERTGGESVVFFTRDLSAEGLKKAYAAIQGNLTGKVAVKLHTGEQNGPNIIPRPWVKSLMEQIPNSTIVETVVLLSHKKPDSYIHIDVEFGEGEGKIPVDKIVQRAEQYKPKERVTYKRIKEYILEKYGFKVHTAYIAEVKRSLGLPMYDAPNAVEKLKQARKHPTPEKVEAIKDALHYFAVI